MNGSHVVRQHREPCGSCATGTAVVVTASFYTAALRNITVTVPNVEMYQCTSCGETYFSPEQAKDVSRRIKETVFE